MDSKCPHCLLHLHVTPVTIDLGQDPDHSSWKIVWHICPKCKKRRMILEHWLAPLAKGGLHKLDKSFQVFPKGTQRPPAAPSVPPDVAADYHEACLVLADSPKASAALSRRCLQNLLRTSAGVKHSDLSKEIQQVLDSKVLPSHLADSIDAVRQIGNFSAHPIKSTASGEILPVEPGEAEWTLEVLEALFDFYYVQPALIKKKRDDLNAKLASAGKPPMK